MEVLSSVYAAMHKSIRISVILAGLALLLAFSAGGYLLGFGLGEQFGEQQANTDTYARHAQDEIDNTCTGLDGNAQTECIVRVVEANNEHKRSEGDLIAQRRMARWAALMLLATIAMALVSAVGVYYVWQTLGVTREIGQAQVRAYLGARVSVDVTHDNIRISVRIINHGQTPARNIRVQCGWAAPKGHPQGLWDTLQSPLVVDTLIGEDGANAEMDFSRSNSKEGEFAEVINGQRSFFALCKLLYGDVFVEGGREHYALSKLGRKDDGQWGLAFIPSKKTDK